MSSQVNLGDLIGVAEYNDIERRKASSDVVDTSETTTSTTFTDLTTSGPAVTVTTGTEALVIVTSVLDSDTASAASYMGFAVSGATTVAASDGKSGIHRGTDSTQQSAVFLVTGLTAGSNTFTAKYRADAGSTARFDNRNIIVIPQ